jgi:hypothetical protein
VLAYGLAGRLGVALGAGVAVGLVVALASFRFQAARWRGAPADDDGFHLGGPSGQGAIG